MRQFAKLKVLVFSLAAGLLCATGAFADTLSWTVSGNGVSGSGTMTAINEGAGVDLVENMTGYINITVPFSTAGGAIMGFSTCPGGYPVGGYCTSSDGGYSYNDLIYTSSTPEVDSFGLVFTLNGSGDLLNLCSGAAAGCNNAGSGIWLDDHWSYGLAIDSFTAVPEPVPDGGLTTMLLAGALLGLETLRRKFRV